MQLLSKTHVDKVEALIFLFDNDLKCLNTRLNSLDESLIDPLSGLVIVIERYSGHQFNGQSPHALWF